MRGHQIMATKVHAVMREFALDGATPHIFREMTIPVLFSH